MDRLFETQKKTETATEKAQETLSHEEKSEKIDLRLKTPEEKALQFEEQTFSVTESDSEKDSQGEEQSVMPKNSYLQSFENKTVADIMHEEAERQAAELRVSEKQKESLAESSFDPNMTIGEFQKSAKEKFETESAVQETQISQEKVLTESLAKDDKAQSTQENSSIIEKPNYDFLQEPKTIRLSKKSGKTKKKRSSKTAGIVLACALAGSAVICVTNAVLIDQMSASYVQIDETYKFNLAKYLKDINNLDATKKSMDFLETYPDDPLNAGDLGEKSNWFDRLCNFLGGLFGG